MLIVRFHTHPVIFLVITRKWKQNFGVKFRANTYFYLISFVAIVIIYMRVPDWLIASYSSFVWQHNDQLYVNDEK